MWKRPRTWITLALLILLNMVAWDIRTAPHQYPGVIPLYQQQKDGVTQYTDLKPDGFYFGSIWFSWCVSLFIGFVLPFLVAHLLPWLWHRRKHLMPSIWRVLDSRKKRVIVACLVLLVALNVLAWDIKTSPFEVTGPITLYQQGVEADGTAQYTQIWPGKIVRQSPWLTYAWAVFVGFILPFAPVMLPWLWRRFRHGPGRSTSSSAQGSKVGAAVATLVLLVGFNVLAWDWVESRDKNELVLAFEEGSREEPNGFSYRSVTYYAGIAPGIRFADKGTSVLASFFVGEILPLLLVTALFRRRQPPALPLPPVAGAPR